MAGKYIQLWLWAIMHMISNDKICAQCPRTKEYHDTISSRVPCQSSTAEVFGFLSALWVLEHSQCACSLSMCMAAPWVPKHSLWMPGWPPGIQVRSGCLGTLLVPGCSVGSWALCGFLGYLCVHGRFLLVPGLCLDSWAISVCIGTPSGYFSTPSGCLRAVWVPGHSFIAAMKNRCYSNLSEFGYM